MRSQRAPSKAKISRSAWSTSCSSMPRSGARARRKRVRAVAFGGPPMAPSREGGSGRLPGRSQDRQKWVKRFQEVGEAGLEDRSSKPHRSPLRIAKVKSQRIIVLRRRRRTMERIARELASARATVRSLARAGLSRLSALDLVDAQALQAPKVPQRFYRSTSKNSGASACGPSSHWATRSTLP